jgi:hypothetical protein
MKNRNAIIQIHACFCALALLAGCPTEPGTAGGGISAELRLGEIKYFSLSTGLEVDASQANTTGWDIAFERRANLYRMIYTNGGDTAAGLSSGGLCEVYYTGKTDLGDVHMGDRKSLPGYDRDTKKWVAAMGTPEEICLNVMNYVGYGTGSGGFGDAFSTPFLYNQKQFYTSPDMGVYQSTDQVYIIRHADGSSWSRIQIYYEYDSATPADLYLVWHEEIN